MPASTSDVLVIGGGPAGLFAASRLAQHGFRTTVVEEHPSVGDPVHCTGILATESFDELDLPRESRLNDLHTARLVSPAGTTVRYATEHPMATVIDRGTFDRALAARAVRHGVTLHAGVRATRIVPDTGGVVVEAAGTLFRARLVLLACGARYALHRSFGLGVPKRYLHTAQRELPANRVGDVELQFGRAIAPDGFGWAVPVVRPEGLRVRIGVMTSAPGPDYFHRMVSRVADAWGIAYDGVPPRQKILPLGAIGRTYADRLLVIGDAAGLVKPTTGGGIYYSVVTAALASEVAAEALARDTLDAATLAGYEQLWRARIGDELAAQHSLRAIAEDLTDAEMDALFELARTDGVLPLVRKTIGFNEHRHFIAALFRHAPARRILFRAFAG